MKTVNYTVPARVLYNTLLRDMLTIMSVETGYDNQVRFTKRGEFVYIDFPFQRDIALGYNSRELRNVWTTIIYKFKEREWKRDTGDIFEWLSVVWRFYNEKH